MKSAGRRRFDTSLGSENVSVARGRVLMFVFLDTSLGSENVISSPSRRVIE